MNLAEIAVELRLSTAPLPEVAFAAYLETVIVLESRKRLELLAAEIGLSREATQVILDRESERARLLAEAFRIIKALIPYQFEVEQELRRALPAHAPCGAVVALPVVPSTGGRPAPIHAAP